MKAKRVFYTIGITVVMAALMIFLFLNYEGNFSRKSEAENSHMIKVNGDVSVRHQGVWYTLKDDTPLKEDDTIHTGRTSDCELTLENRVRVFLDGNTGITISKITDDTVSVEVTEGGAFFDSISCSENERLLILSENAVLYPSDGAVLSVETYTGSQTADIYQGSALLVYDGEEVMMQAGDHAALSRSEKEEGSLILESTLITELRDFFLRQLIQRNGLCYELQALRSVIADRDADRIAVQKGITEQAGYCTLEICCDTILKQEEYDKKIIPEDGMILLPVAVPFESGESVFDVLKRACANLNIDLEYRYLITVGGYYVESIQGISEKDYSSASGWMFRVNGWYPNYVSSDYEVLDGDIIVWGYSCDGIGTDLGREEWVVKNP